MAVETPERQKSDDVHNPSRADYEKKFTEPRHGTAEDLSKREQEASSDATGVVSGPDTTNTLNVKDAEETNKPAWRSVYTGKPPGDQPQNFMGKLKTTFTKKGPIGFIIALLMGGGILGGGGFLPALAGIHLKEILTEKLDSMTPVLTERAYLNTSLRLFGKDPTTATCTIKVKCRYSGLSERSLQRLEAQGAKLVDANGKPVTKNPITRTYTGGQKLILANGEAIDASQYKRAIVDKTQTELRSLVRTTFSPRWISFNDQVAKDIRAKKKLTASPHWGEEGDPKAANKTVAQAVAGEAVNAAADNSPKYQTNPDGSIKKDANGNPIPIATDPAASGLDFGDDAQNINDEVQKLKAQATTGADIKQLPDDVGTAATLPEYQGKFSAAKGLNSALGLLNPADFFVGLCTSYQFTSIVVLTAAIIGLTNVMRYSSLILSTVDKQKSGDGTPDEAEKLGNILTKEDAYGNTMGDSFTYQWAAYNTVTDIPLTSSARGNEVIQVLSTALSTINTALGGALVVKTTCNILTNPFVQGVMSLVTFIPGGGPLSSILTRIVAGGTKAAAKELIKSAISKLVEGITKNLSKDALKGAVNAAREGLKKLAKNPKTALFLAGFLLTVYGVPFIAQELAGTEFVGADSVKSTDGTGNGLDAINSATFQTRGGSLLHKDEYSAFNNFQRSSTAMYVADMQKQTNPFDFYNPYSTGNRVVGAIYPLISQFNVNSLISHPASLLSLPAKILSNLNVGKLFSTTAFAADTETQAELNYCSDEYLQAHNIATSPYCNGKYGVRDVGMLRNADGLQLINWMLGDGVTKINGTINTTAYIDGDGNPIPDTEYANFLSTCVTNTEDKIVSEFGDESQNLEPDCYNDKDTTPTRNIFRLYYIDAGQPEGALDGTQPTSQATAGTPEECKSMAADDLGQIACHAYQFDPYGYLWGGGHGGTAQGFMADFKAGKYTPGNDHILDCSGLVRMAAFDAFGVDMGGGATSSYASNSHLKEISKQESKAGDILWRDGHTEIIVSNDPSSQSWKTIGAHQVYPDISKDIGPTTYTYSAFSKVYRFQK